MSFKTFAGFEIGSHILQTNKRSQITVYPVIYAGYVFAEKEQEGFQPFVRGAINSYAGIFSIFSDLVDYVDGDSFYYYSYYIGGGFKYNKLLSRDLMFVSEASMNYYFISESVFKHRDESITFISPMFGIGLRHVLTGVSYLIDFIPYTRNFGTLNKSRFSLSVSVSF